MKPEFDNSGLATKSGEVRCFYYDRMTYEYTGWSDEYINVGVSMPGDSTDINPGKEVAGKIAVFSNGVWEQCDDYRGITVYSIHDSSASLIDYLGPIKEGYTIIEPSGPYQKWDGERWIIDSSALHAANIEAAGHKKVMLLTEAQEVISLLQTKLQLNIIKDAEKSKLVSWLYYLDDLNSVVPDQDPDIIWPEKP